MGAARPADALWETSDCSRSQRLDSALEASHVADAKTSKGPEMMHTFRVGDLMSTAVVFVHDTDTIATARREMRRAGFRHLPVVDEHQNLLGIISSTDLTNGRRRPVASGRIGRSMSRVVVTVTPDTPVTRAEALMLENAFHSLPVVASDGHVVGILTETDLLRGRRGL